MILFLKVLGFVLMSLGVAVGVPDAAIYSTYMYQAPPAQAPSSSYGISSRFIYIWENII
jgi:hypothetical protein